MRIINVFDLFAKIGLDAAGFVSGLKSAKDAFDNMYYYIDQTVGKVTKAAVKLGTEAVTTSAKAFVTLTKQTADYGDNVDKMSQKMGMSAKSYQQWDAVMKHCGTSMETLKVGMKTLSTAAQTGNEAFEQLGLTQEEIANMSQEELFGATIEGLQNVEDTTQRTYLAGQLLGRGATELGALLNTSAEDTQKMKDRVEELGGVMSDDAVKASAKFKDNLQDLKTGLTGLKNGIANEFMPGVNTVLEGFTDLIAGGDDAADKISEGIETLVTNFTKALGEGGVINDIIKKLPDLLPILVQAAVDLFTGFITAFDQVIDLLLPMLPDLIDSIVDGLIKGLPLLVEGGFKLLIGIMTGIAENADKLVQAIIDLIPLLVDAIIENLPAFVEAGIKIIGAIIVGIGRKIGELFNQLGSYMADVWEKIKEPFEKVGAFFSDIWDEICNTVKGIAEKIGGFFKAAFESAIYGVKSLAESIVNTVIDVVNGLIDVVNLIPGVNIDYIDRVDFTGNGTKKPEWTHLNAAIEATENYKRQTAAMAAVSNVPKQINSQYDVDEYNSGTLTLRLTDNAGQIIAENSASSVDNLQGRQLTAWERGLAL